MAEGYHIYIHLDELSNGSAMAGGESAPAAKQRSAGGGDRVANALKGMVSFAAIKSTADQLANYAHSTINLRTGAQEYEQRIQAIYSATSQAVGALAGMIGAGITAGPAGVAVVALGIAANGVRQVINIAQKENTLRLEESVENVSIGMQNVRAGTIGRRGNNQ